MQLPVPMVLTVMSPAVDCESIAVEDPHELIAIISIRGCVVVLLESIPANDTAGLLFVTGATSHSIAEPAPEFTIVAFPSEDFP